MPFNPLLVLLLPLPFRCTPHPLSNGSNFCFFPQRDSAP